MLGYFKPAKATSASPCRARATPNKPLAPLPSHRRPTSSSAAEHAPCRSRSSFPLPGPNPRAGSPHCVPLLLLSAAASVATASLLHPACVPLATASVFVPPSTAAPADPSTAAPPAAASPAACVAAIASAAAAAFPVPPSHSPLPSVPSASSTPACVFASLPLLHACLAPPASARPAPTAASAVSLAGPAQRQQTGAGTEMPPFPLSPLSSAHTAPTSVSPSPRPPPTSY